MIEQVIIKNYKSIRDLSLPLNRLNVLIGSNGVGKSNFISFFELTKAIYEQRFGSYTLSKGGIDSLLYRGRKVSPSVHGLLDFDNNNAFFFEIKPAQSNKGFIEKTGDYFNNFHTEGKDYTEWNKTLWDSAVEESSLIQNLKWRAGYLPWEVLPEIGDFIIKLGKTLDPSEYEEKSENVWIAKSATVAPTASITGPAIIGKDAEVRHCAFIRGKAIVGEGAVVGNSTELKNAVLFNKVQVPHYNYVGDAVLGYKSHMGAGSICSNVKSDKKLVVVKDGDEKIETGLKKFGAMLGDHVEVGCGSVLNPGTVIGRNSNIYPLSPVRGCVPADSIYKNAKEIVKKK